MTLLSRTCFPAAVTEFRLAGRPRWKELSMRSPRC